MSFGNEFEIIKNKFSRQKCCFYFLKQRNLAKHGAACL